MLYEAHLFLWALVHHKPSLLRALGTCNMEATTGKMSSKGRNWPAILVSPLWKHFRAFSDRNIRAVRPGLGSSRSLRVSSSGYLQEPAGHVSSHNTLQILPAIVWLHVCKGRLCKNRLAAAGHHYSGPQSNSLLSRSISLFTLSQKGHSIIALHRRVILLLRGCPRVLEIPAQKSQEPPFLSPVYLKIAQEVGQCADSGVVAFAGAHAAE